MIHRYIATRSVELRIHIRSKSVKELGLLGKHKAKILAYKAELILKPGHLIRNEAIDDE